MDSTFQSPQIRELPAGAPPKPEWADRFLRHDGVWSAECRDVPGDVSAQAFERLVEDAYQAIFDRLRSASVMPIRFWAFIPGIHTDLGDGLDRYMAFNSGRYAAYKARLGEPAVAKGHLPTASAIGISGDRFFLHCLASTAVATQVENPRQIPAYRYSRRYGPVAPSFSRSSIVETAAGERLLLVAGTASILGEDSRHREDLPHQAQETFVNLATLIAAAERREGPLDEAGVASALRTFHDIRIYHPRLSDRPAILERVRENFSPACRVEILQASLCRSELLIEIEGIATPRTHP